MTKIIFNNLYIGICISFLSIVFCSEDKALQFHFDKLSSLDSSRLSIGMGSQFDENLFLLSSLKFSSNLDGILNYSFGPNIKDSGLYYSIGLRLYTTGIVREKIIDIFQIGINRYRINSNINRWIDLSANKRYKINNFFVNMSYSVIYNRVFIVSSFFVGIEKSINNLCVRYWVGYNKNEKFINMTSISYQL